MRVLSILILVLVTSLPVRANTFPEEAYYERVLAEEANVFVDCDALETGRLTCERIKTARRLAYQAKLQTFDQLEGKRRVPYREFALIVYDPETKGFRDLRLGMPVNVAKAPHFQPIVLSGDATDC